MFVLAVAPPLQILGAVEGFVLLFSEAISVPETEG